MFDLLTATLFIIFFYLALGIVAWLVLSLPKSWLNQIINALKAWMRWHSEPFAKVITGIAFAFLSIGFYWLRNPSNEILFALAPELIGTACTILLIDGLYRFLDEKHEKQQVIQQMRSPTNALARDAIRRSEDEGWLTDGSLRTINLIGADLRGAQLSNAVLEYSVLGTTNLEQANLSDANLRGAQLYGAKLNKAILCNTNFENATLVMSQFANTQLIFANLKNATIENSGFQNAYLNGADLTDAQIYSSDLSGASLQNAIFKGAKYNRFTTWPLDFDPKAAGATCVDCTNS